MYLTGKDYGDFVYTPGEALRAIDIAKMIDHSLLKPEMTKQEVIDGCQLAKKYECATVCVKPCDVEIASKVLKNSGVLVTTVIGFPHGSNVTEIKLHEAQLAIKEGCKELDMVLNIGRLRSKEYNLVETDIRLVCDLAHGQNVKVKVILENAYLTDEEKVIACRICEKAEADWVKTSTGYAKSGATTHDLRIMRRSCSPNVQVKAAGGVRTLEAALSVRAVGGTRFGCTATQKIVEDARALEAQGKLVMPKQILELA